MVGSPIAANIMDALNGAGGYKGWQWLFIIEGVPSVIAGICAYFLLTDSPKKTTWLTAKEKAHVEIELAAEDRALGPREHNVWASLRNPKVLVLILVYFCIVAGNATLVYYGPSVVREVGFQDIKALGWVMAGIYARGWLGMIFNGYLSDRNQEIRYHTAIAAAIGAVGLLLTAYFLGEKNTAGVVVSLALSAAGTMGAIPVYWQIPGRFLSGTAIVVGLAVINSIANLADYFSPQLLGYLKTTTGRYAQGLTMIAFVELIATALLIFVISTRKLGGPARA